MIPLDHLTKVGDAVLQSERSRTDEPTCCGLTMTRFAGPGTARGWTCLFCEMDIVVVEDDSPELEVIPYERFRSIIETTGTAAAVIASADALRAALDVQDLNDEIVVALADLIDKVHAMARSLHIPADPFEGLE